MKILMIGHEGDYIFFVIVMGFPSVEGIGLFEIFLFFEIEINDIPIDTLMVAVGILLHNYFRLHLNSLNILTHNKIS